MDISKHHVSVTTQRLSDTVCPKTKRFTKKDNKNQLISKSETNWTTNIGGINYSDQTTICLGINCKIDDKDNKCKTDEVIDLGEFKPVMLGYEFDITVKCKDCSV